MQLRCESGQVMKSLGTWFYTLTVGKQEQTAGLKEPDHVWANEPSANIYPAQPLPV